MLLDGTNAVVFNENRHNGCRMRELSMDLCLEIIEILREWVIESSSYAGQYSNSAALCADQISIQILKQPDRSRKTLIKQRG